MRGTSAELKGRAITLYPEFDEFFFPSCCSGGMVGPGTGLPGEKALDLRHKFGINLAGIYRINEDTGKSTLLFGPGEVGAKTIIQDGDVGLCFRWIDKKTGDSVQLLKDETIRRLAGISDGLEVEPAPTGDIPTSTSGEQPPRSSPSQ